jgi:hypothetical protein
MLSERRRQSNVLQPKEKYAYFFQYLIQFSRIILA